MLHPFLGIPLFSVSLTIVDLRRVAVKRSHIGAAGMRSELTFERGGTVVVARVMSGEAKCIR